MLAELSFGFGEDLVGAVTEAIFLEMMGVVERKGGFRSDGTRVEDYSFEFHPNPVGHGAQSRQ